MEFWLPQGIGLALLVFVAELCVVTISTVRIIFISRSMKGLAALLGFFEITIWLFAIGQIMQHLSDLGCYLGFAGGFTLGNYLGVMIEKRLGIGSLTIRAVTRDDAAPLVRALRRQGCGVTSHTAEDASGPVKVVVSVIRRKQLDKVLGIVASVAPTAFCAVDQLHAVRAGAMPADETSRRRLLPSVLFFRVRWFDKAGRARKTHRRLRTNDSSADPINQAA
jgi:uncharacterized protein YebE (UPF0316 family)